MNNPFDLNKEEFERMTSNPFYCLSQIDPIFVEEHPPLVDEKTWIRCGVNMIKEIGAEKFLTHLLENLKGNYISLDPVPPFSEN